MAGAGDSLVKQYPPATHQFLEVPYSLNYLIDMEHSVILDVEATPTRISKEVDATETMIERIEERFALKPERLAGDVAYQPVD